MAQLRIIEKTKEEYDRLEFIDPQAFYMISDSHTIIVAGETYTGTIVEVPSFPSNPKENTIYVRSDGVCKIWTDYGWLPIAYPVSTSISKTSSDEIIPSEQAVREYVEANISQFDSITNLDIEKMFE